MTWCGENCFSTSSVNSIFARTKICKRLLTEVNKRTSTPLATANYYTKQTNEKATSLFDMLQKPWYAVPFCLVHTPPAAHRGRYPWNVCRLQQGCQSFHITLGGRRCNWVRLFDRFAFWLHFLWCLCLPDCILLILINDRMLIFPETIGSSAN